MQEADDPLADAPPPRYAVESDDEDEYVPLSRSSTGLEQPQEINVELKSSCSDLLTRRSLIFASGEAGVSWAKSVNLGEQQAVICVNDLPVGLLFLPPWTSVVIVVSEAEMRARLPLFAITDYTTAIIDHLQPTSVAILDSYSTKTYVSSRVIPQDMAPIRYLSIGKTPILDSRLAPFSPPNLLQSTTASLLNALYLRSISEISTEDAATIILLPSPKVLRPPPSALGSAGVSGHFGGMNWDRASLELVHNWLFAVLGEEVHESSLSTHAGSMTGFPISGGTICRSTLGEVGESGMYI